MSRQRHRLEKRTHPMTRKRTKRLKMIARRRRMTVKWTRMMRNGMKRRGQNQVQKVLVTDKRKVHHANLPTLEEEEWKEKRTATKKKEPNRREQEEGMMQDVAEMMRNQMRVNQRAQCSKGNSKERKRGTKRRRTRTKRKPLKAKRMAMNGQEQG
jgi:hypothetical protein